MFKKITSLPNSTRRFIILGVVGVLIIIQLFFLVRGLLFKSSVQPPPHIKRVVTENEMLMEIYSDKKVVPEKQNVTIDKVMVFRNMDSRSPHTIRMDYVDFTETIIYPDSEYTFVFTIPGRFMVFVDRNKDPVGEIIVR